MENLSCLHCHSGFGVFASKEFAKGDFLLHYRGTIVLDEPVDTPDTYVYEFTHKGKTAW